MKSLLTTALLVLTASLFAQNTACELIQTIPTAGTQLVGRPVVQQGVVYFQLGAAMQQYTWEDGLLSNTYSTELSGLQRTRNTWQHLSPTRLVAQSRQRDVVILDPQADSPVTLYRPASKQSLLVGDAVYDLAPTQRGARDWTRRDLNGEHVQTLYQFDLENVREARMVAVHDAIDELGNTLAISVFRIRPLDSAIPYYLLLAYDLTTQKIRWTAEHENLQLVPTNTNGVSSDERQVILVADSKVVALDLADGTVNYVLRSLAQGSFTNGVIDPTLGTLYLSHTGDGLSALDLLSGELRWTNASHCAWYNDMIVNRNDQLFVLCQRSQALYLLDAATGQQTSGISTDKDATPFRLGSLAVDGDDVYIATSEEVRIYRTSASMMQASR